ncbi:MAG TPA: hypothetical protein RMF84_13895 [Polyangiaceae bacterium LLY-WYZ-14_1]|nr:hypothetical protein [Polyangiaceae bacterium LLY-WYZ-14_1]
MKGRSVGGEAPADRQAVENPVGEVGQGPLGIPGGTGGRRRRGRGRDGVASTEPERRAGGAGGEVRRRRRVDRSDRW